MRSSVGDYAGRNPRIWIDANDQRRFLKELRRIKRDRRGEARVAAMSPDEFELIVRVVDSVGHFPVEDVIGRLQCFGHRYNRLLLRFSFTPDRTMLPKLVREKVELTKSRLTHRSSGRSKASLLPAAELKCWASEGGPNVCRS